MKKVLIYRDYGCSDLTALTKELKGFFEPKGISVDYTDAKSIVHEDALNKDVVAFFMPGGAGTPYRQKLENQGNEKIYDYVKNGGVYFGICAGAYYACKKIEFETDIKELKIVSECGLDLVEGRAIGTLYKELDLKPFARDANSSAVVRLGVKGEEGELVSHYHGGPYFDIVEDGKQKIEATYKDVEGEPPAIISKELGKGLVILSGVHIEDKGEDLKKVIHDKRADKDRAMTIANILIKQEEKRETLFLKMMNKVIQR
ncbi:MAG: hypothetical protein BWY78_00725 [Alphaproteobacteria bacterium ADurb.Bin438]|nr:MAG: hypothetical protein BWY78_00725 [Alphaproteobacteria bacterium ADurb.Bin438]